VQQTHIINSQTEKGRKNEYLCERERLEEHDAEERGQEDASSTLDGRDVDGRYPGKCLIQRQHVNGVGYADGSDK